MTKRKKRNYSEILINTKQTCVNGSKQRDERFWQLTRDKDSNGFAVIRFLPDSKVDGLPFRPVFKHSINIGKRFMIDKCPTTIGKPCAICEWNKSQPSDWVKEQKTYRKKSYYSNILVVSDPGNPANEGKQFLFEFGPQLFKIIQEKLFPTFAGEEPLIFFDPDEGANFKIKVKKDTSSGYATWTSSEFAVPTVVEKSIEQINESHKNDPEFKTLTWNKIEDNLYDLQEVINDTSYKTYDEQDDKLTKFLSSVGLEKDSSANPDVETTSRESDSKVYSATKKDVLDDLEKETSSRRGRQTEDESLKSEDSTEADDFASYFKDLEK